MEMKYGKIIGYREINPNTIDGYNADNRYIIISTHGGCMDSADSPIRIPDGTHILCHLIKRNEFLNDWEQYRDRVVVVSPLPGIPWFPCPLVKQFLGIDYGLFIKLRMYVPFKEFSIAVDCIKDEILIVDQVIS